MNEKPNRPINQQMRATKGLRIVATPPKQPRLNALINEHIRGEAAKATTHIPLDHPALTGRDRK